jgi:hypothetical protein
MLKKIEEKEAKAESAQMAKIAKTKAIVEESNKYYNENAKPGSLASKANMVAKYNEKHDKGSKKIGGVLYGYDYSYCQDSGRSSYKSVNRTSDNQR